MLFRSAAMWLSILILAWIAALLVRFFWELLAARLGGQQSCQASPDTLISEKGGEVFADGREETGKEKAGRFLLRAGVIFLCYIPVFLAVYPGFFVYDAQDEYLQVVTRSFSTHHPLLHVLLLGGIIQLVYKLTGSYNLGIACYTQIGRASCRERV